MALSISQTAALSGILKTGMRIASMGYPDIIAPKDMIEEMLNHDSGSLEYRKDSEAICKRHGIQQVRIPDAHSLFELLGCELDVYDVVQERGCEHLCDLNYPWTSMGEAGTQQKYDIVLDVGTVEHCFNISQAMMNMAGLLKINGVIIHENPFNCGNHGFYNLNPTWYHDFYTANGFKLLGCCLVTRDGRNVTVPHTDRFNFTQMELNVFAMAQRMKITEMVYPAQTKYAKLINAVKEHEHGT